MGDDPGPAGQVHDLAAPLVDPGQAAGEIGGAQGVAPQFVHHPAAGGFYPLVDAADDRGRFNGPVQAAQFVPDPVEKPGYSLFGGVKRPGDAVPDPAEQLRGPLPQVGGAGLHLVPVADEQRSGGHCRHDAQHHGVSRHHCRRSFPKQEQVFPQKNQVRGQFQHLHRRECARQAEQRALHRVPILRQPLKPLAGQIQPPGQPLVQLLAQPGQGPVLLPLLQASGQLGHRAFQPLHGRPGPDAAVAGHAHHLGQGRLGHASDGGPQALHGCGLLLHASGELVLHQGDQRLVKFLLVDDLALVVDELDLAEQLLPLGHDHGLGDAKFFQPLQLSGLRVDQGLRGLIEALVGGRRHVSRPGEPLLRAHPHGLELGRPLHQLAPLKGGPVGQVHRVLHNARGLHRVLGGRLQLEAVALQIHGLRQAGLDPQGRRRAPGGHPQLAQGAHRPEAGVRRFPLEPLHRPGGGQHLLVDPLDLFGRLHHPAAHVVPQVQDGVDHLPSHYRSPPGSTLARPRAVPASPSSICSS